MLLIGDPQDDRALAGLTPEAWHAWVHAVDRCARARNDIVSLQTLGVREELLDEWEQAALVQRLPFGNVRLLRRGSLWEIGWRTG
jgi:hypothetical protein